MSLKYEPASEPLHIAPCQVLVTLHEFGKCPAALPRKIDSYHARVLEGVAASRGATRAALRAAGPTILRPTILKPTLSTDYSQTDII